MLQMLQKIPHFRKFCDMQEIVMYYNLFENFFNLLLNKDFPPFFRGIQEGTPEDGYCKRKRHQRITEGLKTPKRIVFSEQAMTAFIGLV